jgi:hypothetical protein
LAAQQILAETGPRASAFPSAAQFSSRIGVCPGREESAEQNHSSRCAKGNVFWAIVRHITVVTWKILHEGIQYEERGSATTPQAIKCCLQRIKQELRTLGYSDALIPLQTNTSGLGA